MVGIPESLRLARAQALQLAEQPRAAPGPYRRNQRPGAELPAWTPPRGGPRSAREAQRNAIMGAPRDIAQGGRNYQQTYVSQLRDGGLPDAVRDLPGQAFELTGLPSFRRAGRAAAEGDVGGAALETGMGALGLMGMGIGAAPRLAMAEGQVWRPAVSARTLFDPSRALEAPTRVPRAIQPQTRASDVREPITVFRGSARGTQSGFQPFSHFGTERAAKDRLRVTRQGARDRNARNERPRVDQFEIQPGRTIDIEDTGFDDNNRGVIDALVRGGHFTPEELAHINEPMRIARETKLPGEMAHFEGYDPRDAMMRRASEVLRDKGITAIRYRNVVEDPGQYSYIVPHADNVGPRGRFSDPEVAPPMGRAIQPQTRTPDGRSILPQATPRPFRRTEARSEDLREAATRPDARASDTSNGPRRLYSGRPGEQGSRWATPDPRAANDYATDRRAGAASGAVDFIDRDPAGALTVRSGDDIAAALPDSEQHLLDRFDDMAKNEMPWEILGNPAVQAALRRNGVSVVHLPRDISPNSIQHESYLFLDEKPARPVPVPPRGPEMRGGTPEAMQRAREQGFDVDTPLYHGTTSEVDALRPSSAVRSGGVFLTRSADDAAYYAGQGEGANILPLVTRGRYARNMSAADARAQGYDGLDMDADRVIFDPRNIRSRFAAFDPARAGESDLLAAAGAPLAAAALFSRKRRK